VGCYSIAHSRTTRNIYHFRLLQDIHQTGVQSLTDWMAVSIELYYTIAQSVLVEQPCDVSMYVQKAATLARWSTLTLNSNALLLEVVHCNFISILVIQKNASCNSSVLWCGIKKGLACRKNPASASFKVLR